MTNIRQARERSRVLRWMISFETIYFPLLFISCGIGGVIFSAGWLKDVRKNPEILHPPYNPNIWRGSVMAVVASAALLGWTLIAFILQFFKSIGVHRWWWLTTIFARLAIIALHAISDVFRSRYLPRPLGLCMNDDRWPRSANVPSDTPTMYQILPLKHHTDKYGKGHTESPCYRLVKSWKFDVGVTIVLAVSVLLAAVILTWHRSVQDGYIKKKGHEHHFKERRASTPIMEPVLVVRDWWQSKRAKNEQEHELIPSEPPRYSQEYGDRKGGVA